MSRKLNHRKALTAVAYILENRRSAMDKGLDEGDLFEEAIDKARNNVLDTRRDHLGRDRSEQTDKAEVG